MNAERFAKAIGNIGDKFVLEYEPAVTRQKKKPLFRLHPKWSIAACLAVVVAKRGGSLLPISNSG